jgi:peptidoglycan/xylan/chitin deacetylase (PgdA/CDA1 family)
MSGFRLDRFFTLYFFHSFVRRRQPCGECKIPILMYHSISDDEENAFHPYYHINTSAAVFEKHMRYLAENAYSVVDLDNLEMSFDANNKLVKKFAVITFDDGYYDFYTKALPILQEYNLSATVFLPTDFIGNRNIRLRGKEHLTWSHVVEMSACGISFGSHTVTHPELSGLRNEYIEYELKRSKETIEDKLGKAIDKFSYPFKFPEQNKVFITLLRERLKIYGYKYGVSTRIGTTSKRDDTYFMKRIPISSCDDISLFKAKLEGGYDWVYRPQLFSKMLKRFFVRH